MLDLNSILKEAAQKTSEKGSGKAKVVWSDQEQNAMQQIVDGYNAGSFSKSVITAMYTEARKAGDSIKLFGIDKTASTFRKKLDSLTKTVQKVDGVELDTNS